MTVDEHPPKPWGPDNPHPLSQMKTELIWEGKYDEYGNRRPVKLPTTPLPLQRIETIDEPHDREKARQLGLFDEAAFGRQAHPDEFRNMLIWGDNKLVMASLLEQFRGKVDLIYIDPPFDVGADFSMQVQLGDNGDEVLKEQSIMEAVAYRDTWGKGTDSYLHMMYERLTLMHDLLSERGTIYVHCDWRVVQYMRTILDDIFGQSGPERDGPGFKSEIIWFHQVIGMPRVNPFYFPKQHETILAFSKAGKKDLIFNSEAESVRRPFSDSVLNSAKLDSDGKLVYRRGRTGTLNPWAYDERYLRTELDPQRGVLAADVWDEWKSYQPPPSEKAGFATQKPSSILERIISASSERDSLIADFFCGSGTTMAVAEKLGRRWIGVDLGRYAIHVSRKRLIQVQRELHSTGQPYRSFDVYNLGRYERQWWQLDRLRGYDTEHRRVVLEFYRAAPLETPPSPLLHGKKGGAYVHVAPIDSVFSEADLRPVAEAASSAGGRELHCLAWEFEMELTLKKEALEAETGLTIRLKYIPREIMEPNRKEVQFFEAGYLEARVVKTGNKVDVELVRFIPALAEAPEAEMVALQERAVRSPFDFIDFWAVDFNWHQGEPFEHHWQNFRTRKDRQLKTRTDLGWEYQTSGKQTICVKVIDVFGVDTSTRIEVEV